MDESQLSSSHASMFGKVHLQFRSAMIGSHMLMHLKGRRRKQLMRYLHSLTFVPKSESFISLMYFLVLVKH